MKIVLAILGNIFTSYWLIRGIQEPEKIGFVKDQHGALIQPDSIIMQITGWLLLLYLHAYILYYLYSKLK